MIQKHSPQTIPLMIESNIAEFFMTLGRIHGDEVVDTPQIKYVFTTNWENRIFRANITKNESMNKIVSLIKERKISPKWYVTPSSPPILKKLLKNNFNKIYTSDWIGMAVNLQIIPENYLIPEGLEIIEVKTISDLNKWIDVLIKSYSIPEDKIESYHSYFLKLGINHQYKYYLGLLNGRAVATSILFAGKETYGIYYVGTLSQFRRKGIGLAMMYKVLNDAKTGISDYSVLAASFTGSKLYKKIGFKEYYRTDTYEWKNELDK